MQDLPYRKAAFSGQPNTRALSVHLYGYNTEALYLCVYNTAALDIYVYILHQQFLFHVCIK